jgi:hypothetical protein
VYQPALHVIGAEQNGELIQVLNVHPHGIGLSTRMVRRSAGGYCAWADRRLGLLACASPTCAPCKLQPPPIVDPVLVEWRDKIDYELVDVAERPEIATQYGVWSVPTTIVLDAQRRVIASNQGVV